VRRRLHLTPPPPPLSACRWPPFYDKNLRKMCEYILKSDLAFPATCTASAEARDLIRGLLMRAPGDR